MFADIRRFVELQHYPGDFELPRINDCDEPGMCHDWAGSQYIDNFSKGAGMTWDLIGGHTPDKHLHFDTFADDAWRAGAPPNPPPIW
mmetsp:Transcript_53762/g.109603  ORF Transcript_53762/g.109603 Transcript_53762/m.109603 type:complete len:87 (-) Transcript_53762:451-711(-)